MKKDCRGRKRRYGRKRLSESDRQKKKQDSLLAKWKGNGLFGDFSKAVEYQDISIDPAKSLEEYLFILLDRASYVKGGMVPRPIYTFYLLAPKFKGVLRFLRSDDIFIILVNGDVSAFCPMKAGDEGANFFPSPQRHESAPAMVRSDTAAPVWSRAGSAYTISGADNFAREMSRRSPGSFDNLGS